MKFGRKLLICAALLGAASSANADGGLKVDGALSFSLTRAKVEGMSFDQAAFNLVSDLWFSDQLSLGFDLDFGRLSADGNSLNLQRFQLEPTVHLSNGAYIGTYFQDASIRATPIGIGLNSYGVFGGMDAERWAIEGYLGRTSLSGGMFDEAGSISADNIGVTLTFRPTDKMEIFGHFASGEPGMGEDTTKISVTAIGAQYDFSNGLKTYGAFERFSFMGSDIDGIAIGGVYALSALGSDLPGSMTLELGRTDIGSGIGQTQVTIGWLIPLGGGSVEPLSSIARTARGGTRSPIVAGFGSLGLLGALGGIGNQ
jgi:hypothetical protein